MHFIASDYDDTATYFFVGLGSKGKPPLPRFFSGPAASVVTSPFSPVLPVAHTTLRLRVETPGPGFFSPPLSELLALPSTLLSSLSLASLASAVVSASVEVLAINRQILILLLPGLSVSASRSAMNSLYSCPFAIFASTGSHVTAHCTWTSSQPFLNLLPIISTILNSAMFYLLISLFLFILLFIKLSASVSELDSCCTRVIPQHASPSVRRFVRRCSLLCYNFSTGEGKCHRGNCVPTRLLTFSTSIIYSYPNGHKCMLHNK